MRRAAWIVLAVMVVGAIAVAFWPRGGHESEAAHVHRLASELRCVDCEGLSVADSSAASAREQRSDIGERMELARGDKGIAVRPKSPEFSCSPMPGQFPYPHSVSSVSAFFVVSRGARGAPP